MVHSNSLVSWSQNGLVKLIFGDDLTCMFFLVALRSMFIKYLLFLLSAVDVL